MAVTGDNPGQAHVKLSAELGTSFYDRVEAAATPAQKKQLAALTPQQVAGNTLGGDPITAILTRAPGNDAPLGGLKVVTEQGWFAARPSGTEDIYKIYAESFRSADHLQALIAEAQAMVTAALAT